TASPYSIKVVGALHRGGAGPRQGPVFCAGRVPRPMDSGTDWRNPAVVNDPVQRPTLELPSRYREDHMRTQGKTLLASILVVVIVTATASAQQAPSPPPTTPYGAPIGLEAAKKVMAPAFAT